MQNADIAITAIQGGLLAIHRTVVPQMAFQHGHIGFGRVVTASTSLGNPHSQCLRAGIAGEQYKGDSPFFGKGAKGVAPLRFQKRGIHQYRVARIDN